MSFFRRTSSHQPSRPPAPATSLGERRAIVEAIGRANEEHTRANMRFKAQLEEAAARVERARQFLRDAETAYTEIQIEQFGLSASHGLAVGRFEAQLRSGAPESIDAFIGELAGEEDAARAPGVLQVSERTLQILGEKVRKAFGNADSVRQRLEAIRNARAAARAMKLEAIPEDEVRARLQALAEGLPEIDPFIEMSPLLTPGERREAEWRSAEARS